MDINHASATDVAVRQRRILAVGGADYAAQWGASTPDNRLADTVLMPGFVEGHAHMMAGAMWTYAYAGFHDRIDPDGKLRKGMTDIDAVTGGLIRYCDVLAGDAPLVGWGFDPIFLPTERLNRRHLDQISPDRPIAIIYSNFHLMCVNSKALEMVDFSRDTTLEGVIKGPDGAPRGELQEMAAMFPIMRRLGIDFGQLSQTEPATRTYGEVAKRAGVTTITDLFSPVEDSDLDLMLRVTGEPGYPLRIVPALGAMGATPDQIAVKAKQMALKSTDKLRLGAVKLMTDGSIQGWTARIRWSGYIGGQPTGVWNTAPDQIYALCEAMHREGIQMHIHVNGDEATEVSLDAH